jgi:hypothetical protein
MNLREKNSPSKVRLFKDSLRTLQFIIKIVLFFDKIKLFVLISFLLFLFSMISFLISIYNINFFLAGILTLLTSIIVFCIGMLSETIKKRLMNTFFQKNFSKFFYFLIFFLFFFHE